jgi:tyrosyl-tRNA synthetase
VEKYLHIFTFYSQARIAEIMASHNSRKELRSAQTILSEAVIRYLGEFESKNKEYFTLSHEELVVAVVLPRARSGPSSTSSSKR